MKIKQKLFYTLKYPIMLKVNIIKTINVITTYFQSLIIEKYATETITLMY